MRFDILAVFAALAINASADRMEVFTKCGACSCDANSAFFYTDYGAYKINAQKGCRGTSVPGMVKFCVDWDERRAHFKFSGQSKRCLTQDSQNAYGCSAVQCYKTIWREIPCHWR
ncbi:uncharacterized protein B0J16DRAFT_386663 [Fusarium flagelliforme]|uniref:uncharacterized protein n=1 Tax=Fusarium flagelliforme TaxID=2675880 RepID=UPI001E8D1BBA|nr:uncharacterized protein B0J16DRAFT_386663 [Fusarium flagelliforme]KAH7183589.1 hypothetical protein B0J16DRAFT_386663 [Fusarium flagelliforme]